MYTESVALFAFSLPFGLDMMSGDLLGNGYGDMKETCGEMEKRACGDFGTKRFEGLELQNMNFCGNVMYNRKDLIWQME